MKQKKRMVTVMGWLLAIGNVAAQSLHCETAVIDVGDIAYRQPWTVAFRLTNVAGKEVTVDRVETNCGCVAAHWPQGKWLPDAAADIQVTYDARLLGRFEKVIAVYAGAEEQPLLLRMKGRVVAEGGKTWQPPQPVTSDGPQKKKKGKKTKVKKQKKVRRNAKQQNQTEAGRQQNGPTTAIGEWQT